MVVFVHDNFERAARAQAVGLRIPDLRIYVYPQYKPAEPSAKEAEKAVQAVKGFQALLLEAR